MAGTRHHPRNTLVPSHPTTAFKSSLSSPTHQVRQVRQICQAGGGGGPHEPDRLDGVDAFDGSEGRVRASGICGPSPELIWPFVGSIGSALSRAFPPLTHNSQTLQRACEFGLRSAALQVRGSQGWRRKDLTSLQGEAGNAGVQRVYAQDAQVLTSSPYLQSQWPLFGASSTVAVQETQVAEEFVQPHPQKASLCSVQRAEADKAN